MNWQMRFRFAWIVARKSIDSLYFFADFATVPADLMSAFQLIPYASAEDAVFKALGVE